MRLEEAVCTLAVNHLTLAKLRFTNLLIKRSFSYRHLSINVLKYSGQRTANLHEKALDY